MLQDWSPALAVAVRLKNAGLKPQGPRAKQKGKIMKYTTVKISEIAAHPTRRLDAGYWIKKKAPGPSRKQQAPSSKRKKRFDNEA